MTEKLRLAGETYDVAIAAREPCLRLEIGDRRVSVDGFKLNEDGTGTVNIDGRRVEFRHAIGKDQVHLAIGGRMLSVDILGSGPGAGTQDDRAGAVRAPMPGVVIELHCEPGQTVASGAPLMTIESMKLQTELRAPIGGTVATVSYQVGEMFDRDALLIALEPPSQTDTSETG